MIAAGVAVCQTVGRKTEQMKDGGVQVAKVNFALNRTFSGFVSATVGKSSLHAATSHPERESARLVTSRIAVLFRTGCQTGAAKLAPPDHQGVFEQAPLIEVLQERSDRRIRGPTICGQITTMVLC